MTPVPLRGWGRTGRVWAERLRPTSAGEIVEAIGRSGSRRIIPRGMGRSHGDAAQISDGLVLDLTGMAEILEFDTQTGVLVAEAGATLGQVLARTRPQGWIPAVLPGTAHVTLGGAVACDVHGKNHFAAGSFGRHVGWLDLVRADGEVVRLGPDRHPDEFWATVGGMGLTGVILRLSLRLRPAGGWVVRHRQRARALSEVLWLMDAETRAAATGGPGAGGSHVVAWIDATRRGPAMGRGIIETARLLDGRPAVPEGGYNDPGPGSALPSLPGPGLVSTSVTRLANSVRWQRSGASAWSLAPVVAALQPLDRAELWPALFGWQGLVQCQVAVPDGAEPVLLRVLVMLASLGTPPALATLKRFGAADSAPLSFAAPGWTLAMDFPGRRPQLARALDRVHAAVAEAGGRAYLAKDSQVSAGLLRVMYPRLGEWQRVRNTMDPAERFSSDLGRRLGLASEPACARPGSTRARPARA